jgi:hypothetical protein
MAIKVSKQAFQEIIATHQWMEAMPDHLHPTRKLGSSFYENIAAVFRSFIPEEMIVIEGDYFNCFNVYEPKSLDVGWTVFAVWSDKDTGDDCRITEVVVGE